MKTNKKPAITLMIQGTTSDAGKSVLVTGLCRLFCRMGLRVAPFKPQNIALNSAVTEDGGEIGRAQAVQAQACRLKPHTDMNPILLKPNSETGAQIIIHGKAIPGMDTSAYQVNKATAVDAVLSSHRRLSLQYDLIIAEGSGSPAEINLRDNDIANMGFAEAVDCPVLLVSDIDRGGVFAHLFGTRQLLSTSEQRRIKGFIINKFRGDVGLLETGNQWLEEATETPVLGTIPYLQDLHIEAEDTIVAQAQKSGTTGINVVVPVLPHISNHTDFDALRLHPQVDLSFVREGEVVPAADLIILPGTKNVRADLYWLKSHGWQTIMNKHLRYGGKLLGICGGLQMLGGAIHDPYGIEGLSGSSRGLGFFSYETTLQVDKQLKQVHGCFVADPSVRVSGYEIHSGDTVGISHDLALIQINDYKDGIVSEDQQIMASYLHGIFDHPQACNYLLQWAGLKNVCDFNYVDLQEQGIERLADTLEQHLDISEILKLIHY